MSDHWPIEIQFKDSSESIFKFSSVIVEQITTDIGHFLAFGLVATFLPLSHLNFACVIYNCNELWIDLSIFCSFLLLISLQR